MHRDPMPHPYSDRRDLAGCLDHFAVLHPDAGEAIARRCRDLALGEYLDEKRFDPAQITMQILAVPAMIEQILTD